MRQYKRDMTLGEKGVGRFAAHKLGNSIKLVTRMTGKPEVVVEIDWTDFETKDYLDEAKVSVIERSPVLFKENRTGTYIEIMGLRDNWTRGMMRNLHRSVMSICSPFGGTGDFKPELILDPEQGWLSGLLDVSQALEYSLFHAKYTLKENRLTYDYTFEPLPAMRKQLEPRQVTRVMDSRHDLRFGKGEKVQIGEIALDIHIFDRDPQVLELASIPDKQGLKDFLKYNGGIRVYRDEVRVYDYGEPANDWLSLGGRRVNVPARRVSNNLIIGAVSLKLDESQDLIEKTNREGFVENDAYDTFLNSVLFTIEQIEFERNVDKERIRFAYSRKRQKEPVLEDLTLLRNEIEKRGLQKELTPYIDRVETQFREVRDRLLTAAGSGLSLAVVIHEVEKGIQELAKAVERDTTTSRIKDLATHLSELIEGLTYIARRSGAKNEKASALIRHAIFNTEYRTRYHGIKILNGIELGNSEFSVKCTRRLIIATLMNLIDNSIWWLDNKGGDNKRIYLGTSFDIDNGLSIIVADSGPGFIDPPEYLTQPFMGRKPDGMGLGLHLACEVMKAHNGRLEFPEIGDVALPSGFNGAILALVFKA